MSRRIQLVLAVIGAACGGLIVGFLLTAVTSNESVSLLERQLEGLEQLVEEGRHVEKRLPDLERSIAHVEAQTEELDEKILAGDADETARRIREAALGAGFTDVGVESVDTRATTIALHDVVELRHRVSATTQRCCWAEAFEELSRAPLLVLVEDVELRSTEDPNRVEVGFVTVTARVPEATEKR